MLDYDQDGWPDLLVANDTQPNKLYRNQRNGTFKDVAVEAGIAFSAEGKARAGMGVDVADFDNTGVPGVAITNFDNEMIGLYRVAGGSFADVATQSGVGLPSKNTLGFGCVFLDADLDGSLDLAVVNGHIDDTVRNVRGVGYAQPPQLFLNNGKGIFHDVAADIGGGFSQPKVGRGLAYGDFDRDGDLDLLMTTNHGPAYLYRNDQLAGNRSIRFRLVGTKSNRDGIGASLKIFHNGSIQSRLVKGGSSYLSQSELPVTFGVGKQIELPLPIRTPCNIRSWQAGQDQSRGDSVAQRPDRRIQGPHNRPSLRVHRRKGDHSAEWVLGGIHIWCAVRWGQNLGDVNAR